MLEVKSLRSGGNQMRPVSLSIVFVALLTFLSSSVLAGQKFYTPPPDFREWKSKNGETVFATFHCQFNHLGKDRVELKRQNSSKVQILLKDLSEKDVAYIIHEFPWLIGGHHPPKTRMPQAYIYEPRDFSKAYDFNWVPDPEVQPASLAKFRDVVSRANRKSIGDRDANRARHQANMNKMRWANPPIQEMRERPRKEASKRKHMKMQTRMARQAIKRQEHREQLVLKGEMSEEQARQEWISENAVFGGLTAREREAAWSSGARLGMGIRIWPPRTTHIGGGKDNSLIMNSDIMNSDIMKE